MRVVRSIFGVVAHRGGLLTVAVVSLGLAVQVRDGLFSWWAVLLLTIAFAATLAAIAVERAAAVESLLFFAVALQLAVILGSLPASDHESQSRRDYLPFYALIGGATVLLVIASGFRRERVAFVPCLMLFLLAGVWLIRAVPSPFMDVFVFQSESSRALLNGVNPYTIDFPDIYGSGGMIVYAPDLVRDGRVNFGFPYMPLTLLWDTAGQFAAGDYRYAQLAALAIAAVLIAAIDWSRTSALAALLLLFTPRSFYVILQGWSEPMVVMFLALVVYTAARAPRLLPFAIGLLIASKQYCVLCLLALPLLMTRLDWRFVAKIVLTVAVVTLPVVVWNFAAFWNSAVVLQIRQPFRSDALSFPAAVVAVGGLQFPSWIAILLTLAAAVFTTRRLPKSTSGYACATSLILLTFFALNKQAFVNYYLLVIAALSCAIASLKSEARIVR